MTNRLDARTAAFLVLIGMLAFASPAGAALGTLEKPYLSFGKDYPEADHKKVDEVLNRPDCKYLGGAWLNAFTTLRYGGDTIALNQFVEALSLCPGIAVHVSFYRATAGTVEADWMVTQTGNARELQVRVNIASKQIDLEKLYLPPVKAPSPPPANP